MNDDESFIIAAIVENKPGVLYHVSNMFRRRGFNINSITVGSLERSDLARMTITVIGDERVVDQVVKQMNKLIDVIKVSILEPKNSVMREMALIKVHASESKVRSDIINYADVFRGHVVDVSSDSMMIEITGDSEKINAFINLVRPFGIKEIARTGITALVRGPKPIEVKEVK